MKFDPWLTNKIKVNSWSLFDISEYIKIKKSRHFATCKLNLRNDRDACDIGLRYINTQITYRLVQKNFDVLEPNDAMITRVTEMSEDCLDQFSTIFSFDRFSVDKNLPESFSKTIKRAWIKGALEGKNNRVVYGHINKQNIVDAFCVIKPSTKMWNIDLIGVLPSSQGMGLGQKLLNHVLYHSEVDVVVGTQEDNISSNLLYKRYPYEILSRKFVYHGNDFKPVLNEVTL